MLCSEQEETIKKKFVSPLSPNLVWIWLVDGCKEMGEY